MTNFHSCLKSFCGAYFISFGLVLEAKWMDGTPKQILTKVDDDLLSGSNILKSVWVSIFFENYEKLPIEKKNRFSDAEFFSTYAWEFRIDTSDIFLNTGWFLKIINFLRYKFRAVLHGLGKKIFQSWVLN